tara:strand:- start:13 stop:249 length:237 start_codon:yes stop_codon:yes gene_type:complete
MEAFLMIMIALGLLVFLANLDLPKVKKNPIRKIDKRMRKESEKALRRNPDSSPSFFYYVFLLFIGMVTVNYFFGLGKN